MFSLLTQSPFVAHKNSGWVPTKLIIHLNYCHAVKTGLTLMYFFKLFLLSVRRYLAQFLGQLPGNSTFFGPPRHITNSTPLFIKELGTSANAKCKVYSLEPRRFIYRQLPFHADDAIAGHFHSMKTGYIKEQFVAEFERGRYWGRTYGYILNSGDCLHRDLSPSLEDITYDNFLSHPHDSLSQPLLPPLRHVSGISAAINTPFANNFHHWLLDCVPKFGLLKAAGFQLSEIDQFILAPPTSPWHLEVLRYLDIPLDKVIFSTPKVHIRADNLIVPSFSEPSRQPEKYNYTPEGLQFVRNLILSQSSGLKTYPEKIVVSREKTSWRRLIDADSIHFHLENYGFTKVILEDFSLADQAMIFHSAKVIIMPTGGGLANLVFCRKNTKVIEIFSPYYLPTFSLLLANSLSLQYIALVGDKFIRSSTQREEGVSQDIHISLERLLEHALD